MKTTLFCIALSAISTLQACKHKPEIPAPTHTQSSFAIPGKWKWVLTTGGFAGVHETPASTGMTKTYTFNADSTYTAVVISGGTSTTTTGNYSTGTETTGGITQAVITMNNTDVDKYYFTHNMDSLFLTAPCCDRFNYTLVKE